MARSPSTPLTRAMLQALARTLRRWAQLIQPECEGEHRAFPEVPPRSGAPWEPSGHPATGTGSQVTGAQATEQRPSQMRPSAPLGGPPPHWVERVQQAAPGLLLRPEEGGVPALFGSEPLGDEQHDSGARPVPQSLERLPREGGHPTLQQGAEQRSWQEQHPKESQGRAQSGYGGPHGQGHPRVNWRSRVEQETQATPPDMALVTKKGREAPRQAALGRQYKPTSSSPLLHAFERMRQVGRGLFGGRGVSAKSGRKAISLSARGAGQPQSESDLLKSSAWRVAVPNPRTTSSSSGPPMGAPSVSASGRSVSPNPPVERDGDGARAPEQASGSESRRTGWRYAVPIQASIERTLKIPVNGTRTFHAESSAALDREAAEAVAVAFKRARRAGRPEYSTSTPGPQHETGLDDAVFRHGSGPRVRFRPRLVPAPPAGEANPGLNRWPELPPDPPPLADEWVEATRLSERAKRLDLEQRGEDPWSA